MGVIGPSSYLPNDVISPQGSVCEKHNDRPAVKSIVGETDSFGSETMEVCQECLDEHNANLRKQRTNPDPEQFLTCESCSTRDKTVKPTRDPEEGSAGPVYHWCAACRKSVFDHFYEGYDD